MNMRLNGFKSEQRIHQVRRRVHDGSMVLPQVVDFGSWQGPSTFVTPPPAGQAGGYVEDGKRSENAARGHKV